MRKSWKRVRFGPKFDIRSAGCSYCLGDWVDGTEKADQWVDRSGKMRIRGNPLGQAALLPSPLKLRIN